MGNGAELCRSSTREPPDGGRKLQNTAAQQVEAACGVGGAGAIIVDGGDRTCGATRVSVRRGRGTSPPDEMAPRRGERLEGKACDSLREGFRQRDEVGARHAAIGDSFPFEAAKFRPSFKSNVVVYAQRLGPT